MTAVLPDDYDGSRSAQLRGVGLALSRMAARIGVSVGVTLLAPSLLIAQKPPTRSDTVRMPARSFPCNPSAWAITVQILDDASGAAIRESDATVTVTRTATGRRLRNANELPVAPFGRWVILTGGDLSQVAADGEKVMVEVRRNGRTAARRSVTVALDATACHMTLLGEAVTIRLR